MELYFRNRFWMYDRTKPRRAGLKESFVEGVDVFIDFACRHRQFQREGTIRCPCVKCNGVKLQPPSKVKLHLYKKGFKPNYWYWTDNGEEEPIEVGRSAETSSRAAGATIAPDSTVDADHEAAGRDFGGNVCEPVFDALEVHPRPGYETTASEADMEDPPTADAKKFFDLLDAANRPMWEGCRLSELSTAVKLLSIKSDCGVSQRAMDEMVDLMRNLVVEPDNFPRDYNRAKNLVSKLGLKYQRIDCCPDGCMLYYKDAEEETLCRFCGTPRYKETRTGGKRISTKSMHYLPIIPRLQRLFASMKSAPHMRWHAEHRRVDGVLCHPSDGYAWKYFDEIHSAHFASDPRNVRLGLCADGFSPFNQVGTSYSCWPVILTPYNLPPEMCMTAPYMFLTCIIPGPHNPKSKIDVYLQPLIDELLVLWSPGVLTYDISVRRNFTLRAALMWTINDFPAYGMLSGWQTAGKLACPYCMERTKAFTLPHGGKSCWFDCHRQFLPPNHVFRKNRNKFRAGFVEKSPPPPRLSGDQISDRVRDLPKVTDGAFQYTIPGYGTSHKWTKRSIFWDLPYWKDNIIRHNLDVMHIEKNVWDNICNTVMDVKGKTKDNEKARRDIEVICRRPELHLVESANGRRFFKPKAVYTLTKEQRRIVCEWIKQLKLPDGYASNIGSRVDISGLKLHGLKSHDCHVLMQCLMPVMFKSLPKNVWEPLTELSVFFRDICSTTLITGGLQQMEENIPVTLCKLEMILPPGFFDVMEHLAIHLPFEAWAGGPVQYRWMYPFERYLGKLKRSIRQKARVEGSICEAYITRETANFMSYYFDNQNGTASTSYSARNDDGGDVSHYPKSLSIFNQPGRPSGACTERWLTDVEIRAAHLHVLINCDEVLPFVKCFQNHYKIMNQMDHPLMQDQFPIWFREYVCHPNYINCGGNPHLRDVSYGPLRSVKTWNTYFVSGYKFHTSSQAQRRKTDNSGVCVKGDAGDNGIEEEYYGTVEEIMELEYQNEPIKKVVLFRCEWFDPTLGQGTRVHPQFRITEIKHRGRYGRYDPFVVAQFATQVYFIPYPEKKRKDLVDWWVVLKNRPIGRVVIDDTLEIAYQGDYMTPVSRVEINDNFHPVETLADNEQPYEEVDAVREDRPFIVDDDEQTADDEDTDVNSEEEADDDDDVDDA